VDRSTAALIRDLKQRGMLDDTLVPRGGEFGRTPRSQEGDSSTDELGYAAEENLVSVHDFHATMLHLLGVDHKRLAVKFQGLDVRLTGISGDVVKDILV
jgi:hypothetical protein